MILHCVFCNFKGVATQAQRNSVLSELADFALLLDGVLAFDFGPNRDFEGKSQGYSDGFVIRFADRAALETYAAHPTHIALGGRLCDICVGGADGITVFDLETNGP